MQKKSIKTINLKINTSTEEMILNKFKKLGIYHGQNIRELFIVLMKQYNLTHDISRNVKLVTEPELLREAAKKGLNTNKALLIKHRNHGNLDGMWWGNPDGRVVYDLVPVLKFFRGRQGKGAGTWLNRKNAVN